jgi:predicted secreted protein
MRLSWVQWVAVVGFMGGCSGEKVKKIPPGLGLSPATLEFHVVALGKQATDTVSFNALTSTPVNIKSAVLQDITAGGAAAFQFTAPAQVAGGGSTPMTVTYAPKAVGADQAKLVVTSDDPDHPTASVTLSGHGADELVQVAVEYPDGGTQDAVNGQLAIDLGTLPSDVSHVVWPQLLLENQGGAPAVLTAYAFQPDSGPFYFPQPPTLPQAIAAQQVRSLPLAFAPTAGGGTFNGTLSLTFDDPKHPSFTVSVTAKQTVKAPPLTCAGIRSVEERDGTTQTPASFRAPVPVEPGARVELTAFSDDLAGPETPACTVDPQDGRTGLIYVWTLTQKPSGSQASIDQPATPRTVFTPDVPGTYSVSLAVTSGDGRTGVPAHVGDEVVTFVAAPLADLTVNLDWPGQTGVDLDLHVVQPGGRLFQAGADQYTFADGGLDWGHAGDPTDNPHFSGDDQGNGALRESVWLNFPEHGCLTDGGCDYGIYVHYFRDNRVLAGGAVCGLGPATCVEGEACGCAAGEVCEPNPGTTGICAPAVHPQVSVYFKGQVTPALAVPVPVGSLALNGPCFTWHAADVRTPAADAGQALVPDGGALSYWGDHADSTRQCTPAAGGYAPTTPPDHH